MAIKTKKVTKLRAIRAERGLSADEMAELLGIGRSSLYGYEKQTRRITRPRQLDICAKLGIDETDLSELVDVDAGWLHRNTVDYS